MSNNFKAIETVYKGYRFRSRLEARWAVFFDALGIKWEYEKEGYELEGIRYLPDFWLPEQDCFVEIKGEMPSDEEQNKAKLLALYAQKNVWIWYGPVEIVPDDSLNACLYSPPSLWKFDKSEGIVGGPSTIAIHASSYILALIQGLFVHRLGLSVRANGKVAINVYANNNYIDDIDSLIDDLNNQVTGLKKFKSDIETHEDEIREVLSLEDGWEHEFLSQEAIDDSWYWVECKHCGSIKIGFPLKTTHSCHDKKIGQLVHDSPRLLSAYAAARSARFEFGEKGKWHGKH